MGECSQWISFLALMGVGFVAMSSMLHPPLSFFSSAPASSSYSYGAINYDLPLPLREHIREGWENSKALLNINENKVNQPKVSGAAPRTEAGPGGRPKFPMLRGVSRPSSEYQCMKGWGFFEGPADENAIQAMLAWKINAVRVTTNEDCWLNRYVPNPQYGGDNYKRAMKDWVDRLRSHGLYVVLDLHWTEGLYQGEGQQLDWDHRNKCYDQAAKCQKPMPNLETSVKFWKEVAETFKGDDGVIFDLFNEPFPDSSIKDKEKAWNCWRNGREVCGFQYTAAGMQDLVTAVRETGAKNLLMLGGLDWSNDLDGWLEHLPYDPENNLAASYHNYNFNKCKERECWERTIGKIVKTHPVIVGELGQNDCKSYWVEELMTYLEEKKISYFAWSWTNWPCASGPALLKNYNGDPTEYGKGFKKFLEDHVH